MTQSSTLILSKQDIQEIIFKEGIDQVMDLLIADIQKAMFGFDPNHTKIPVRSGFNYRLPEPGLIEWMPVYNVQEDVTIKVVGYHPENPKKFNLPTILSTISCYNTTTGHLEGLIDGVLATSLRTGAASAVASTFLAKENSTSLGLIGCGAQSITQIHGLSRKFDLEEVLIYDADEASMASFKERIAALDLSVKIEMSSIEEIITSCDIICTATSIGIGEGPLFENITPKPHAHFNAVGSDFPGKVELPLSLLENCYVSPDFLEQALQEGECQQLLKGNIGSEISQIVQHPNSYVSKKEGITVFDSTGWALEDHVVFKLFARLAEKHNIGSHVDIEYIPEDAKNPYEFIALSVVNKAHQ